MDRFLEKVKVVGECWEWQAACRIKGGYGSLKYKGKMIDAHRMSYILFKGTLPDGMLVCHTCDNRKCVNPDHLFLGTHKDNYHDAYQKGRVSPPKNEHLRKHPSLGAYKRGCHCSECRELNRIKNQKWRSKDRQLF